MPDNVQALRYMAESIPEQAKPDGRSLRRMLLESAYEIERLRTLAKRLSDALLTVAPLGGSECFIRSGDDYYADPEWFKHRIADLHARAHEGMKQSVHAALSDGQSGESEKKDG